MHSLWPPDCFFYWRLAFSWSMKFATRKRQRDRDARAGDRDAEKEHTHETSIHSRLVSHSAQPASVDDIPVLSMRAVAGALVSFSYFVSQ
jgi:hypothetical protein